MPLRERGTAVVELISEFLEAITHEILYRRGLYNPDIFERERLYGIALHKSRHPDLNLYISDSILSLKEGIRHGAVRKVAVCFLDAESRVHERYVISITVGEAFDPTAASVESVLRGSLLKLQYADACMKPLPKGCTFHYAAYTSELEAVPTDLWVEEDPFADENGPARLKTIIPIKSGSAPGFRMQLHVETQP